MSSVFVFNGPSSSGKTSIAKAVQAGLSQNFLRFSIDDFYRFFNPDTPNDWKFYYSLNQVFFRMIRASLELGYNAVIDTVFERKECYDECVKNFNDFQMYFIGFYCSSSILMQREVERGNRPIGLAERQANIVNDFVDYNLTVHTDTESIEACSRKIISFIQTNTWG